MKVVVELIVEDIFDDGTFPSVAEGLTDEAEATQSAGFESASRELKSMNISSFFTRTACATLKFFLFFLSAASKPFRVVFFL